ncbi:outer membrane lipoprotein carrier protein LolA [Bacillus sp. FJAT-47783]|uniref:LolA family protein n=1 Tax=Bacillus sp. FJAT-47783 TaxID=2922712 RepID=UPI001FABAECE|nr:outer membrane lipoprotein carrier protein LolA [Bacillus sp. FJAT-47783]
MRRGLALSVILLLFIGVLAACGGKSQEDITNSLNKKVEDLKGYKADAKMTIQTGEEPQVYEVAIWHKKPDYYRVALKNASKEQSQIILRNDDGVFVLTPALNKSFRFQSEWPQNSSQAYLYESLVKDVKQDSEATFQAVEKSYVFETKTNYQNSNMLPYQEITFNKDLSPKGVKVMDVDKNPLVTVEFSNFEIDPKFDQNAFDMEKNMSNAQVDIPTLAQPDEEKFAVMYPLEDKLPMGVTLKQEKEVITDNGKRVVLTYSGDDRSFTLIQERSEVAPVTASEFVSGEPVDLGFTVGALTENSISWTYDGVDYMLASSELTQDEMVTIAQSVQAQAGK